MSNQTTKSEDTPLEREEDDAVIGRAFLGSTAVFAVIGMLVFAAYWFLSGKKEKVEVVEAEVSVPGQRVLPKVTVPVISWSDITESAGLQFQHINGATGEKLLPASEDAHTPPCAAAK